MHLHIIHRLPIVAGALLLASLLMVLIGSLELLTGSLTQRQHSTNEMFRSTVDHADKAHRHGRSLVRDWRMATDHRKVVWKKLHGIERERRKLQRQLRAARDGSALHAAAGGPDDPAHDAVELLGKLKTRTYSSDDLSEREASRELERLMQRSGLKRDSSLPLALDSIYAAESVLVLTEQDQKLQRSESLLQADYKRNEQRVRASRSEIMEARQMMRQVQSAIEDLQSHLSRFDAQIERWQERNAISRGELDPQRNKYEEAGGREPEFHWPATGTISATFHEQSYLHYFGIQHNGIDIAVNQGTPVLAAEDGVVFLAHDGGLKYSYVLIGHRKGYATLYGHLSDISVIAGQHVARGEHIGRSGGTPGTRGAGSMTTGAHLHFEVIRNGEHVHPESVLP